MLIYLTIELSCDPIHPPNLKFKMEIPNSIIVMDTAESRAALDHGVLTKLAKLVDQSVILKRKLNCLVSLGVGIETIENEAFRWQLEEENSKGQLGVIVKSGANEANEAMGKTKADADATAGAATRFEQQGEAYSKKSFGAEKANQKGRKGEINGKWSGEMRRR